MLLFLLVLVQAGTDDALEHLLLLVVFALPPPALLKVRLHDQFVDEDGSSRCYDGALRAGEVWQLSVKDIMCVTLSHPLQRWQLRAA